MENARRCSIILIISMTAGCQSNPLFKGYSSFPLELDPSYRRLIESLTNGKQPLIHRDCFSIEAKEPCAQQRNEAVAALIISSEEICLAHRRSMYGNEATTNIILGTMTNLFAGAAAVISNQKYRPVYAALALFSNSERSLINETVYKQMLVPHVDKKIVEIRKSKIYDIDISSAKSIKDYGANRAVRDVVELHTQCSFMDGLQKALDEGTQGIQTQRILRLKSTLSALDNEYKKDGNDPKNPTAEGLKARIKAVSDALLQEEVK